MACRRASCSKRREATTWRASKPDKAVEACDLAIRNYPTGDKIPEALYRKGMALSMLKDTEGARGAWDEVVKKYPDSDEAQLARQGLERLKRPDR